MKASSRAALSRLAPLLIVAVGVALFLPGLDVGFIFDDYYHLAVLEELDPSGSADAIRLWTWAENGESPVFSSAAQGSVWPWWAAPDLRIHFFRPLPALVHGLDHRLYGREVSGWHVTSLLLWAALLLAVVQLYRQLDRRAQAGPGVVLLAGLLFALDEAHTWNVVWLATRHSLIAVLFAVASITAYLRFRDAGSRPARAASLGLLALGLLSSEVAVGVVLWVLAYELVLARERPAARLRAAAPMVLLTLVYVVAYTLTGHGSHGTGWYVDPFDSPVRFAREVFGSRFWDLLQGLLTPSPAESGPIFDLEIWVLAGRIGTAVVFLAFVPLLVRDRVFRFVATGSLLSILPTAAAMPINYLLLLPSVGTAWLVAAYLGDVWQRWRRWRRRRREERAVEGASPGGWKLAALSAIAVLLLLSHAVVAPLFAQLVIGVLRSTHEWPEAVVREADFPDTATAGGSQVLVVTTPSPLLGAYYPVAFRVLEPPPWPEAIWTISSPAGAHRLTREGDSSFTLEIPEPGVFGSIWDRVVHPGTRLRVGSVFRRGELEVEVTRVVDTTVREIRVRIRRPLDAPGVWLLYWDGERLSRFPAPAVGESRILEPRDHG